jgi:hypothetical protein
LLDLVITALFASEKGKHISEWAEARACHTGKCTLFDHFPEWELDELREEFFDEAFLNYDEPEDIENLVEELMSEELAESDWFETCYRRREEWLKMIALVCSLLHLHVIFELLWFC